MTCKFIDLSVAIEHELPSDPPGMLPRIQYMDHKTGAQTMKAFFPDLKPSDLPSGLGWAVEVCTLSTHAGTHMDAPWHYHPYMDNGKPALTIDQMPLEWCMGPGVVLDFSQKPDGYKIMPADVDQALQKIGHTLKPGDIVLARSGADRFWGTPEYLSRGCGFGRESTLHILDRGIHVVGTDAWSWDPPLPLVANRFRETHDPSIVWEGHFAGIEHGYFQIEKLANLDKVPPFGFTFFCFPVKIKGASASWIRAVAMLEESSGQRVASSG
jgi:kynurenine formamidase